MINPFTRLATDAEVIPLRILSDEALARDLHREISALNAELRVATRVVRAAKQHQAAVLQSRTNPAGLASAWVALCDAIDRTGVEAVTPEEVERLRDVDAHAGEVLEVFARIEIEDHDHATESRVVSDLRGAMRGLAEARAVSARE